jgi:hypothetical protein
MQATSSAALGAQVMPTVGLQKCWKNTIMQEQIDRTQLIELLRQQLPLLGERYRVESLGVFGSFVRHEQRPDSDLDVLVTFREPPSLLKFIELENYLSGVLGIKIDLVMKEALKPHIGQSILNEVVTV